MTRSTYDVFSACLNCGACRYRENLCRDCRDTLADLAGAALTEYYRVVSAAATHPEADARRVLTAEHVTLRAVIDSAHPGRADRATFCRLRAATREAARVRRMWTPTQ